MIKEAVRNDEAFRNPPNSNYCSSPSDELDEGESEKVTRLPIQPEHIFQPGTKLSQMNVLTLMSREFLVDILK